MIRKRSKRANKPVWPRARLAIKRMAPSNPPIDGRSGKLRLDFNENTVGCSPRVVELIKKKVQQL